VLFWISFATPQALPGTFSVSHHRPTSHVSNFFWAILTFYIIPEAVILRIRHIRQPRQALRQHGERNWMKVCYAYAMPSRSCAPLCRIYKWRRCTLSLLHWPSHHSFRYCDFYPLTFRPFTFRTRLPAVDTAARFVTGRRRWADFIIEGPGVL